MKKIIKMYGSKSTIRAAKPKITDIPVPPEPKTFGMGDFLASILFALCILIFTFSGSLDSFGLNGTIPCAFLMLGLAVLFVWFTRSTYKGKAQLIGTWDDVGEFRILNYFRRGATRISYGHTIWKMRDPTLQ